jgi:hypothetical protein
MGCGFDWPACPWTLAGARPTLFVGTEPGKTALGRAPRVGVEHEPGVPCGNQEDDDLMMVHQEDYDDREARQAYQ